MSRYVYKISVLDQRYADQVALVSRDHDVVIGRARDCDIRIPSPKISRRHATLWCDEQGRVWVQDLSSANGTFVDGLPARDRIEVFEGSRFIAGDLTFEVTQSDAPLHVHDEALSRDEAPVEQVQADPYFGSPSTLDTQLEPPVMGGMIAPPVLGFSFDDVLDLCTSSTGRYHAYADAHGQRAHLYIQHGRVHEISWAGQPDPFMVLAQFLVADFVWQIEPWEGALMAHQGIDTPLADFLEQFHQRYMGYR